MEVPYVVYTEPSNLAVGVDPRAELKLYFNHDLNPASVTTATVYLLYVPDQKPVRGSVAYRQRVVTFQPASPLLSGAYRLSVLGGPTGVKDVLGEPLPKDYVLQFEVSAQEAIPAPVVIEPADQSLISPPPTFVWQAVPGVKRYEVQMSSSPDFNVLVWPNPGDAIDFVYAPDSQTVMVTPGTDLPEGYYYFRVRADGGVWSTSIGFALGKDVQRHEVLILPLSLSKVTPELFAVNVDSRNITLTFNFPLDATTVTADNVYVIKRQI
ncbi:hypothetical protein MTAT_20490 [Moorella thermoacetica]|uniref:SbsA Ig-like domain-containing protein n=1 Tax=Neomoorella thermoacetica TaxID=1525 RepID=A0AAC9MVF6_NEOTH|nr:Ig-like domain-containing protein [Moorella thermoacetica]AOQ24704.1 hypothetical protein Maut_02276 [Moorella thermoacetica]TYL12807.1 hypothetical protein MTAT_20490 [Moorella thermoacetica]